MYLLSAFAAGLVRRFYIDCLDKLSEGIGGQLREGAVPLYPLNKLLDILCLLFLFMYLLLQILDLGFEVFLFLGVVFAHHGEVRGLLLCAKELISSDALIFLRRNGGEAMKYECLKLEERRIIEEMYAKGAKPGEIAERVGKCQATIYRELERGKTGETDSRFRQGYSAAVAEARVNRSYRNRGRRKAAQ